MKTKSGVELAEDAAGTRLMLLFANGERREARAGVVLFRGGETPHGAYLITKGRVRLTLEDSDERQVVRRTLGVGDVLGLEPVFSGRPIELTATALVNSEFDFVDRDKLLEALSADPALFVAALQLLSRDVVALYDAVREHREVPQRVRVR